MTISISLFTAVFINIIYRLITFLNMVLFQLSLDRRRRFGSTSTRWRSTSDSNVLRIAFFRHTLLKSHGCFRKILFCDCQKLVRQGQLRGSMTHGFGSAATIPILQPWTANFSSLPTARVLQIVGSFRPRRLQSSR
jgi:hypothetical protein